MTGRAVDSAMYEFGPFRLDPAERLLVRDGQPVPLTPKAFDLLVYLVERHGRLVEKQALLSALWPDSVVEEANLAYNVSALRKVLDDSGEGPSMIQTVPTRGYRFTGRVAATRKTVGEPISLPSSAGLDSTVAAPTSADRRRSWQDLSQRISSVVRERARDSIWMLATLAAASIAFVAARHSAAKPQVERGEPIELVLNEQPSNIRHIEGPALSPDAKRIAFLGSVPGHGLRIWIRRLNSTVYEALDGEATPFWSPDSRFLGYVEGHLLKRVEVGAGASQVVCELPTGAEEFADAEGGHPALSGATWNATNDILFGLGDKVNGSIYRVPATGGTARALTQLDRRLGEVRHVFPSFLPDGHHFLYTAIGTRRALMAGDIDSQQHVLVKDIDAPAIFAQPGFLIFRRGNRVVAQRFDPARLAVEGNELPLPTTRPCVTFSVSAMGTLVCETPREGRTHGEITATNSHLAWFDRAGHQLEAITPPGGFALPRLSPDGAWVLSERFDDTNQGDLWIFDVHRHTGYRVTDNPDRDSDAVWSPTGDRVAFTREVEGVWVGTVLVKTARTIGEERVMLRGGRVAGTYVMDWSPDGQLIAYIDEDGINVLPLNGRAPVRVVPNARSARFSPDGRWLAFTALDTGEEEVYVQRFPSKDPKVLVSSGGGRAPVWRRDGRELYYLSADSTLMSVPVRAGSELDLGTPVPLFKAPVSNPSFGAQSYDVSADGQRFLIDVVDRDKLKPPPLMLVVNWAAGLTHQ